MLRMITLNMQKSQSALCSYRCQWGMHALILSLGGDTMNIALEYAVRYLGNNTDL